MTRHLALLRGINVSGHHMMKMEQLKLVLTNFGFLNVETYVQTGNVFLESEEEGHLHVGFAIKQEIFKHFGYDVPVIVIPKSDLEFAITHNPFLKDKHVDLSKLYVAFLSKSLPSSAISNLKPSQFKPDEAHIEGNKIFIKYNVGAGKTKLDQKYIEKKLNVTATIRNWNTIHSLNNMF
jgi:uncharacterized protein (DUF1697 family)